MELVIQRTEVITRITTTILRWLFKCFSSGFSTGVNSNSTGSLFLIYFFFSSHHPASVSISASGIPKYIQFKKLREIPLFSKAPMAMALVGLPMMVPIPPTEAAIGIPTSNALENVFCPRFLIRGITDAITIAVVAVLDRIMEAVMVISIIPNRILPGIFPESFIANLKRCKSIPVFVMASARKNPPINSQIMLDEKVWTYLPESTGAELIWAFPRVKKRYAMINRPTANGGIASVTHKPIEKNNRNKT